LRKVFSVINFIKKMKKELEALTEKFLHLSWTNNIHNQREQQPAYALDLVFLKFNHFYKQT
jgi:hypothetical protein